jgi:anti-anti-sigma factor
VRCTELTRDLNYSIDDQEGIKIVRLSGNISNVNRHEFQALINDLSKKDNVIININKVNLFTSSGLDALRDVSLDARIGGKRVLLLGANENLIKMVEILDLYDDFIFIESIEEGLMKLRHYI